MTARKKPSGASRGTLIRMCTKKGEAEPTAWLDDAIWNVTEGSGGSCDCIKRQAHKISQPRTENFRYFRKAYTPAGKIMMIAVCITAELDCIFSATARRRSKLYTGPNLLPRRSFDCLDVTDSLPAAGGAADSASVPQSSSFTQKHSIDRSDGPGAFFRSP